MVSFILKTSLSQAINQRCGVCFRKQLKSFKGNLITAVRFVIEPFNVSYALFKKREKKQNKKLFKSQLYSIKHAEMVSLLFFPVSSGRSSFRTTSIVSLFLLDMGNTGFGQVSPDLTGSTFITIMVTLSTACTSQIKVGHSSL